MWSYIWCLLPSAVPGTCVKVILMTLFIVVITVVLITFSYTRYVYHESTSIFATLYILVIPLALITVCNTTYEGQSLFTLIRVS